MTRNEHYSAPTSDNDHKPNFTNFLKVKMNNPMVSHNFHKSTQVHSHLRLVSSVKKKLGVSLLPTFIRDKSRLDSNCMEDVEKDFEQEASRQYKAVMDRTPVSGEHSKESLALFYLEELDIGSFLGRGEFSNVFEIKGFSQLHMEKRLPQEQLNKRELLIANAKMKETGLTRYAMKTLRPELAITNREKYMMAARDLARETQFLRSVEHPHIIKIRGIAGGGSDKFGSSKNKTLFLIIDRLGDTLEDRIAIWKREEGKFEKIGKRFMPEKYRKVQLQSLYVRLKVAYDICGALTYLHDRNVIYRDLKPDNLGFDFRGDIKLFDFGLARQIDGDDYEINTDTFQMSFAGAFRYMAPEVMLHKPYNLMADVWSFSMVLWEILSREKPLKWLTIGGVSGFMSAVALKHVRPKVQRDWPNPIQELLEIGWDNDPLERPPMKYVHKVLRHNVALLGRENGVTYSGLSHNVRKSVLGN